jgi:hypothetical protein
MSLSRLMDEELEIRSIRCLDGLHYSFELLSYSYKGLYECCCEIPKDNDRVVEALSRCWGFIDALYRVRQIAAAVPRLSAKHEEMRVFEAETSLAEYFRHYVQHLRGEISRRPANTFPVWGSLSWVDPANDKKCHLAMLGAQVEKIGYTGNIYDRQEQRWVSKVCLAVGDHSFNFDRAFQYASRFRTFILGFLIENASPKLKVRDRLPIISMEVVLPEGTPEQPTG